MNREIIKKMNATALKRIDNKRCPCCGEFILSMAEFKDALSVKEFGISGLCQICQDNVFEGEE